MTYKGNGLAQPVKEQGTFSEISEKVMVPVDSGALGLQASGRLLHQRLQSGHRFADWIIDRINRYRLKEGRDFYSNLSKSTGGRRATDYILSVEAAMHLAIVEESEIGFAIREYLIGIEKRYRDWIGFILPRLKMDYDLFGQREGYIYLELLKACQLSLKSGSRSARVRKNGQEFWRNAKGELCVSETYGKAIITNAIARRLNMETKERRVQFQKELATTARITNGSPILNPLNQPV